MPSRIRERRVPSRPGRRGAAPQRRPHPRRPARGRSARPRRARTWPSILGVSPSTLSRLDERPLDPARKEGELAVLFVRLFRSLDALLGGQHREGAAVAARPEPPPGRVSRRTNPHRHRPRRCHRISGRDAREGLALRRLAAAPGASSSRSTSSPRASWSTPTRSRRLLEQLIEDVKPPSGPPPGLHWLLFTPFRYPPLRHGSRFGTRAERGIWYGSRTRATAFAEKAYYLLLFLDGTAADLTPLETDVSIFQAAYETRARGGPHPRRPSRATARSSPRRPTYEDVAGARPRHARGRRGGLRLHLRPRSRARRERRPVRPRRPVVAPAQRSGDLAVRRHA